MILHNQLEMNLTQAVGNLYITVTGIVPPTAALYVCHKLGRFTKMAVL
jgi:hypothetical protein